MKSSVEGVGDKGKKITQKEEQKDKSMENGREDALRGSAQEFQKERTQVTEGKKSSATGGREVI